VKTLRIVGSEAALRAALAPLVRRAAAEAAANALLARYDRDHAMAFRSGDEDAAARHAWVEAQLQKRTKWYVRMAAELGLEFDELAIAEVQAMPRGITAPARSR
jgi:hypothetical protein